MQGRGRGRWAGPHIPRFLRPERKEMGGVVGDRWMAECISRKESPEERLEMIEPGRVRAKYNNNKKRVHCPPESEGMI